MPTKICVLATGPLTAMLCEQVRLFTAGTMPFL